MTAIKNGIKSILRTPLKTILFTTVSVLLAALLTVSLCVFSAVRAYLADCDAYYHTIVNFEYIGGDYPDASVYDEEVRAAIAEHREALDALLHAKAVEFYEPESSAAALIDGFHRWDAYIASPNLAVLRLYNHLYDERLGVYMMSVSETYYSQKDYTDKMIMVRADVVLTPDDTPLKSGKAYYAVGQYFQGSTPNPWLLTASVSFADGEETVRLPALARADENEALKEAYLRYAESLRMMNDCCRVQYTASLEDYLPFQQQALAVSQGRMFTEEEYADRAHVCILSDRIAGAMPIGVGDSVDLTVYRANGALYEPGTWTEMDAGTYTVVGIYAQTDDYPYRIFLPDAGAVSDTVIPVTGYRLGTFRIRNDRAEDFLGQAEPLTECGFRLTVYDQGYAAATEPMRELMFISAVFLAVCLLLAAAAHALQSHLFVSRQRETALTVRALGAGKPHMLLYFVSAALLLSVVSAAIGCMIGKLLETRVMEVLRQFVQQFADRDLRFSDSRLSFARTLAFEPSIPLYVYVVSAGILLIGSLLFTALFAANGFHEKSTKCKKRNTVLDLLPKRAAKSTKLSGMLKYALLSVRRGVIRTAAVVLLCAIAAVFFGRLTASLDGYRAQYDTYRSSAKITGFATDYKGQKTDGLLVPQKTVAELLRHDDLIASSNFTDTFAHGSILGITERADGEPCDPPEFEIPQNEYAYEGLRYNLRKGIRWINTKSIAESPVFYHTKNKDIRWTDGYSEDSFRGNLAICALPIQLMEEEGLSPGDVIRILYIDDQTGVILQADVKIAAGYASAAPNPIMYSPIGYNPFFDTAFYEETEAAAPEIVEAPEETLPEPEGTLPEESYEPVATDGSNDTMTEAEWNEVIASLETQAYNITFDSFLFTLRNAEDLDALRQALEDAGFTYVNSGVRSKPFAIIEDEMYLNTTQSMERQIQYVGVLYDALYIIAGVIGFVLAWLLTLSRRQEVAVMRAMGTQPHRILLNFLFEQAALSAIGIVIGGAISYLSGCPLSATFLILCGAFWGVWNLSTLICLITGLLKPSYASLTEPE
ncbi:MAG: ABC transporter permease [Clostridia bacterium]|nr:ABC transporter permease [Clostridia bacterium]